MTDKCAYGWAVVGETSILLPVCSLRIEAIRNYVHAVFDIGDRGHGSWLQSNEARAWKRAYRTYGMRVIRVRVVPFGDSE